VDKPDEVKKAKKAPPRPYPAFSLQDAIRVAQTVTDFNGGKPMARLLVANAMKLSPGSSLFRDLVSASARFELTTGNFNSEMIALTALGENVTRPRNPGERIEGMRTAMRAIPLFKQLLDHFNNSKLPTTEFLGATLERSFNVDASWSKDAAKVFVETARTVGVVRDVSGVPYVMMDAGAPAEEIPVTVAATPTVEAEPITSTVPSTAPNEHSAPASPQTLASPQEPPKKRQFFVAHGSDREALAQLQSMLKDLGIPYVTAVDEPHAGRPISEKVADLMKESSGGLFIFSADEQVKNPNGDVEKRARMNVVFELGAASLLYPKRIVVFKEKDVVFPTDFRDLGYIEYERGQLAGTSLQLLKELIKLGAVQLLPGGA
jgi:predicted nucleotide-binding protein